MLFQINRQPRRTKPQLLTSGSISLLDDQDPDRDRKKNKLDAKPKTDLENHNNNNNNKTTPASLPPPPKHNVNDIHPLKRPTPPPVIPPTSPSTTTNTTTTTTTTSKETSSSSPKASSSPKRRHVRFHSVELQEYAVTVGDHPLCKGQFPLTLDWSHSKPKEFRINDYERQRRVRDRCPEELHMDVRERWERLRLVTGLPQSTLAHLEWSRHGCAAA